MADALKIGAIVFVAAVLQVAVFSDVVVLRGTPDLMLVTLVAVSLRRGSTVGACAGFFGGLLIDIATLGTLGLTSLVLTLVGYWAGRYGETTGRNRAYAPYLSVAVMTLAYLLGLLAVRFMLAEPAPARVVLVDTLLQTLALNLLLTWPVYRLVRRLLRVRETVGLAAGVGASGY
jgi:rod shape-determining protein MreD